MLLELGSLELLDLLVGEQRLAETSGNRIKRVISPSPHTAYMADGEVVDPPLPIVDRLA